MSTIITALLITFMVYCIIEGTKKRKNLIRFVDITGIEHIDQLTKEQFDELVLKSFRRKGYTITVPQPSNDYVSYYVLEKDINRIVLHIKRYSIKVDVNAVEEAKIAQVTYDAQVAWIVTNHYYTEEAKWLAQEMHVTLVDRDGLLNALFRK